MAVLAAMPMLGVATIVTLFRYSRECQKVFGNETFSDTHCSRIVLCRKKAGEGLSPELEADVEFR
jgi:hypothetical protein